MALIYFTNCTNSHMILPSHSNISITPPQLYKCTFDSPNDANLDKMFSNYANLHTILPNYVNLHTIILNMQIYIRSPLSMQICTRFFKICKFTYFLNKY